jgi:2'-5' RNA ligase
MSKSFTLRSCLLRLLTLLAISLLCANPLHAEESPVTAIDIVLKPDAVMAARAKQSNDELLENYTEGFHLDSTHNPHITLVQQYVKTADLVKVYAAADKVVRKEKPTDLKLEAFKYYYGKMGKTGLAGIVVKTTPELLRLQKEMIEAIAPYSLPSGGQSAFVTTAQEPEVDAFTVDFVGSYAQKAAGEKFNPHVTTGIGTVPYLDKLLAEPFKAFTFSPEGVCVYQLGSYGTARKVLKDLNP